MGRAKTEGVRNSCGKSGYLNLKSDIRKHDDNRRVGDDIFLHFFLFFSFCFGSLLYFFCRTLLLASRSLDVLVKLRRNKKALVYVKNYLVRVSKLTSCKA